MLRSTIVFQSGYSLRVKLTVAKHDDHRWSQYFETDYSRNHLPLSRIQKTKGGSLPPNRAPLREKCQVVQRCVCVRCCLPRQEWQLFRGNKLLSLRLHRVRALGTSFTRGKMSSCTDLLRLNESRLFKDLKRSLPSNVKETRNILEIRDNVLFVWNAEKSRVLTFNTARGELDEDSPYQASVIFVTYYYIPSARTCRRIC